MNAKVYVTTAQLVGTLVGIHFIPQPKLGLVRAQDGSLREMPTGEVTFTATAIVAHSGGWWLGPLGEVVHLDEAGVAPENRTVEFLSSAFPPPDPHRLAPNQIPIL